MPTRDAAPLGAPCWVDLLTTDPARSRSFYGELLGWDSEEPSPEFGNYLNFTRGGRRIAGAMPNDGAGRPDCWSAYLAVDDVATTLKAAQVAGARIHVDAMPVGDLGVMAYIADPSGAVIGLWQPGTHPGFQEFGEAGTPAWFELHTLSYAAVLPFYRDVFHWQLNTVSDSDDFRYSTLHIDGVDYAGVMDDTVFGAEASPGCWAVYFGVDDTAAALRRVTALGGRVITDAHDTAYGTLAVAEDVTGAQFRLVAPNAAMPGSG